MKTFFLLSILLICLDSSAQIRSAEKKRSIGPIAYQVNPAGTYLNEPTASAPTRINLSTIDPTLGGPNAAGTILKMRALGGFSYAEDMPDDSANSMLGVFVDASGQMLSPGSRIPFTSAPSVPPVPDVPYDFGLPNSGSNYIFLEIPTGAVAILFGANDSYYVDNTDANGNFRAEITYPVLNYQFKHGNNVMSDINGNQIVDLIADAITSVEVELGPNLDVANSVIYWNGVQVPTTVSTPYTGANRKVTLTFEQVTPPIVPRTATVRILMKNSLNNTVADETITVETHPVEVEIYQVIKNPRIYPGVSTAVDLVAGKNMDVVLKTFPDLDIANSTVSFIKGNSTQGVTPPSQLNVKSTGDIAFPVTPVPNYVNHQGLNVLKMELRDSENQLFFTKEIEVTVRKTRPIRLGILPVSGCIIKGWCFEAATFEDGQDMSKNGASLMKVLYPVADDDFQVFVFEPRALATPFYIPFTDFHSTYDFYKLNYYKEVTKKEFKLTHIAGVFQEEYFQRLHPAAPPLGYAGGMVTGNELVNRAVLVNVAAHTTLAHEIGHLFGLEHNCVDIKFGQTCLDEKSTNTGYSNYLLPDTIWSTNPLPNYGRLQRDLINKTKFNGFDGSSPIYSLMRAEGVSHAGSGQLQWMAQDEYLEIFRKNLDGMSLPTILKKALRISGKVGLTFEPAAVYHLETEFVTPTILPHGIGEYLAEVKDIEANVLASYRTDSYKIEVLDVDLIDFIINVPSNAEIVDIYRMSNSNKLKIGTIIVSADTLVNGLRSVNPKAVKIKIEDFLKNIQQQINQYKKSISEKRLEYSFSILREISKFIDNNMTDVDTRSSEVILDKSGLKKILETSLLRLATTLNKDDGTPNALVEIVPKGMDANNRFKIEINPLQKPSNQEMVFIYKAWFDGTPNIIKQDKGKLISESSRITNGEHVWLVQVYIAESRSYKIWQASLNEYKRLKNQYLDEYQSETDFEKRSIIMNKIERAEDKIFTINREVENLLIEYGNSVELRFVL